MFVVVEEKEERKKSEINVEHERLKKERLMRHACNGAAVQSASVVTTAKLGGQWRLHASSYKSRCPMHR